MDFEDAEEIVQFACGMANGKESGHEEQANIQKRQQEIREWEVLVGREPQTMEIKVVATPKLGFDPDREARYADRAIRDLARAWR